MATKEEKERIAAEKKEALKATLLASIKTFNETNPDFEITLTGEEDNKELAEVLKKAEKEVPKKEELKGEEKAPESYDIVKDGKYIRTFSLENHGEEFKTLAESFVAHYPKRNYQIFPSSKIVKVVCLYREKTDAELPLDKQKADSPIVDKSREFTDKEEALKFNIGVQGRTGTAGSLVAYFE